MSAYRATPPPGSAARPEVRDGGPHLPAWVSDAARTANRLASSKVARTISTVAILAVAALLIRGELKTAKFSDVTHAIAATPPWAIAACAMFTAATYLSEAVLEWFVLRFIGKPLKPGRALLAASASSALSIAMGFGIASGTAARLRFYAFAQLSAADVAKVTALVSGAIFLAGLTALGLSGFGGLSTIGAILHWPSWGVAILSAVLLAVAPGWFLLLRRFRGKDPKAMGGRGRAVTLAAGLGNWLFQGAALFVLSAHHIGDFPGFFAAFTLASLFGSALGVPADLGVLEALVMGSHALGSPHQAAAALVLFRVIFQVIPLTIASGALCVRPLAKLAGR